MESRVALKLETNTMCIHNGHNEVTTTSSKTTTTATKMIFL